jgi:hypothetical protein
MSFFWLRQKPTQLDALMAVFEPISDGLTGQQL